MATLPMRLTASSLKRTNLPLCDAKQINSFPFVNLTSNKLSPSLKVIAIFPFLWIDWYSVKGVRFTIPFLVTKNSECSSTYSSIERIEIIFSFLSKSTKFWAGVPFELRPDSGILCPRRRYTFPKVENNKMSVWVFV